MQNGRLLPGRGNIPSFDFEEQSKLPSQELGRPKDKLQQKPAAFLEAVGCLGLDHGIGASIVHFVFCV